MEIVQSNLVQSKKFQNSTQGTSTVLGFELVADAAVGDTSIRKKCVLNNSSLYHIA